ncbi:unnamed protein product, partial [Choristocarpus tenellus]
MPAKPKATSDAYLKTKYELVCKERDGLRQSLSVLERDNEELRKSVYELSYMLSMQGNSGNAALSLCGAGSPTAPSPNTTTAAVATGQAPFEPRLGIGSHHHLDSLSLMSNGGIGGGMVPRVLVPEAKL